MSGAMSAPCATVCCSARLSVDLRNSVIKTTCPYCGVGCGVTARITDTEVKIEGDTAHPANRGRLCSKGSALAATLGMEGRLLRPQIHGATATWNDALDHVSREFNRIIEQHGREAVAFYVSGQLLTEDYYVANKLMKGFIGSANIDTNSRLCMASAVAAHKRSFGEDLVPLSYDDLELADLIVLVGSNTAWCHPVLYQRIVAAKEQRPQMRVVVLDPRRTPTCDIADMHLPVRAGTDVWLFNGLLHWLSQHGAIDSAFVKQHTRGSQRALLVAENTAGDLAAVARRCGVEIALLQEFYQWFAASHAVVTAFSQGVNQSSSGTDKANSIINCHLLTGRIGKPGAGPFSITGQPNAMGGREVGGLANMLAAHMDLDNPQHRDEVQKFWQSPQIADKPGLKAVDLFKAMGRGRIKAVWIMATNPVVSLPDADQVRTALQRCELVVVSDCVADTDTNRLAHVLLPAAAWGEKDGTVTNSDRHISRQRAFLPLPGEARPDWWIVSEVAKRMGHLTAFDYASAADIFAEHARLSGVANNGKRQFDISALGALDAAAFTAMAPTQWGAPRLFADGRFQFPDGRARFVATSPRPPAHPRDQEYPLALNTGRIRDQWHTMTRSGRSARLGAHLPEPFVDLHPHDALVFGLRTGALVRVATRWGSMVGRLRCSGEMRRGDAFVPIHWSDNNCSDARVGALVNPVVDPVSGEPEFKHTPARVEPFYAAWYGVALSRDGVDPRGVSWWARIQGDGLIRHEFAGRSVPGDWRSWARTLLLAQAGHEEKQALDWLEYQDRDGGNYRAALFINGRLNGSVHIAPRPELPSRAWLHSMFELTQLTPVERSSLLAGRPMSADADVGATVCSCFSVGRNTLAKAIRGGCSTVGMLGQILKAGTNCGSCIPELRALLIEEMK
jgi:assimilatory nitrate reductase catalytic subunit